MLVVGIDVVEIARVERAVKRFGERFLERVFTPSERQYCALRPSHLAARFAAKEAAAKALGTGLVGLKWTDIEVVVDNQGKPCLILHNAAWALANALGLVELSVSLSHCRGLAVAVVVGQGQSVSETAPLQQR